MPNIIKDGAIVADTYQLVTEVGALPAQDIVVSLEVWQQQREAILAHPHKKAVLLKPDQHPEVLIEDLKQLDMIALDFLLLLMVVVIPTLPYYVNVLALRVNYAQQVMCLKTTCFT